MPQTGSIATAGAAAGGGRPAGARALRDDLGEDRDRDLARACARRCRARPACGRCARSASGTSSESRTAAPRFAAGDEPDVADARPRAPRASAASSSLAVRGDDERGVGRRGLDVAGSARRRRSPRRARPPRARARSACRPTISTRGARQLRLEEDLQRAAAQAGVVRDDHAVVGAGSSLRRRRARQQAQQHRLAGLQRAGGVQPHGRLRADAADEALDRAVGEHERGVAGPHARRLRRAHDGRRDERRRVAPAAPPSAARAHP